MFVFILVISVRLAFIIHVSFLNRLWYFMVILDFIFPVLVHSRVILLSVKK